MTEAVEQHDFTAPMGACIGCGLYVEECMEVPLCCGVKVNRKTIRRSGSCDEEGVCE